MSDEEMDCQSLKPLPGEGCASRVAANDETPGGRTVSSLKEALQTDEGLRWVPAGHDLAYPAVPFPSLRVMRSAGEPLLRAVVVRQHVLLRESDVAGHLFPKDDAVFARITTHVADFVVEACGGGPVYSGPQGLTCIRTRHLPFTIDEAAREAWLGALWQALQELAFPLDVREEYWSWLEAMSVRMINRRTSKEQPQRWAYAAMVSKAPA